MLASNPPDETDSSRSLLQQLSSMTPGKRAAIDAALVSKSSMIPTPMTPAKKAAMAAALVSKPKRHVFFLILFKKLG
jgi:hypothetical protein